MEEISNVDFTKELNEKQLQVLTHFSEKVVLENQETLKQVGERKNIYTAKNELIRLLLARDFDVKKASEMWKHWVKFHEETKPWAILESYIAPELKAGKAFVSGFDREKHPIIYAVPRRHVAGEIDRQITKTFFIYQLEKALKLAAASGAGRVAILVDLTGFSKKNYSTKDNDLIKGLLSVLQDNYPESLGKLIILKPNWVFKLIFALIKSFLTKRTKSKIVLIDKHEELQKYIDQENLLQEYGGTSSFLYAYPPGSKPLNYAEKNLDYENVQDNQGEEEKGGEGRELQEELMKEEKGMEIQQEDGQSEKKEEKQEEETKVKDND